MVYYNNRDLSTVGFFVESMTGWLTAPRVQLAMGSVTNRLGVVFGGPQQVAPRQIVLRGYLVPTVLSDRATALATLETFFAGRGVFRTADRPLVQTPVKCIGVVPTDDTDLGPQMVDPMFRVEVSLVAIDGGSEDLVPPGPMAIGTTRTPVALGTLPSRGWLHVFGSTSPVTITYTSANGERASALVVTGTLATGESYALDLAREDVWKVAAAGTRTRVSTVSGVWPALDPSDALGTVMPTLAVSSGTGLLVARRRWRL